MEVFFFRASNKLEEAIFRAASPHQKNKIGFSKLMNGGKKKVIVWPIWGDSRAAENWKKRFKKLSCVVP